MSYRCGLGPNIAKLLGEEAGGPRITCDGCGLRFDCDFKRAPPKWFLDGKPPRGWAQIRNADERLDYCPRCKEQHE